jgi:hypothetical protein
MLGVEQHAHERQQESRQGNKSQKVAELLRDLMVSAAFYLRCQILQQYVYEAASLDNWYLTF